MYNMVSKNTPIVQKYGGTSVGTVERIKEVAKRITNIYKNGWTKLAIVVSAQAGETNKLVNLIKSISSNPSEKAYDLALAAGEQISVALLSAALEDCGIKTEPFLAFNLGILTDNFHTKARIKTIQVEKIHQAWQENKVVIVAGFQGITEKNEITTLGRGGSDTTAVALAAALNAGFCEINTDVDGVYTANPALIPQAKLIKILDYEVALEMAYLGSKVLHPRCVEIGKKFSIPITVRNSFKPDSSEGTIIMVFNEKEQIEAPVVSGVSMDLDVVKVSVKDLKYMPNNIAAIFEKVAQYGINVDIIVFDKNPASSLMRISFTVASSELQNVKKALEELASSHPLFSQCAYSVEEGYAKISIVGVGMRSHSGVAARMFNVLSVHNIPIEMITTSEIKISCVIQKELAQEAIKLLHKEFIEQDN